MKLRFFNSEQTRTPYLQLDTRKCKACWKCLDDCPNQVINKINLPWHKHALIIEPDKCSGCLKCMKICLYGTYSKVDKTKQEAKRQQRRAFNSFLINNLLLLFGTAMIISGLVLQFGYHIDGSREQHERLIQSSTEHYEKVRGLDTLNTVWGINYSNWSTLHKFAIVFFSIFMIYHILIHLKWYKVVVNKHLVSKNIQVITLSILFLLVAVTGLVPWAIDLSGSSNVLRLILIEIHDKLALILAIYLILHIIKRNMWFITTYSRLKK